MGVVISLESYRGTHREGRSSNGRSSNGQSSDGQPAGREASPAAVRRLDRAVAALDPLVQQRRHRLSPTIERELRAIGRAVSAGDARGAARRAERLVDLLEHPAASG